MNERTKKLLIPAILSLGFLAVFLGKPLFAKTGSNKVAASEQTNVNAAATVSDELSLENDIILNGTTTATSTIDNNIDNNDDDQSDVNDDDNSNADVNHVDNANDLNAQLRLDDSLFLGSGSGEHGDHGGHDGGGDE